MEEQELPAENDSTKIDEKENTTSDDLKRIQDENKKLKQEFNIQRAKLKELFLQKESELSNLQKELDEMKSQFVIVECKKENEIQLIERKAQEEISSLQQLLQDTMEESTICKNDLEQFQEDNVRLKQEMKDLKEEYEKQESSSLAPVFNQVKKTWKKLGGDNIVSYDSLDETGRKMNKYAQEDAEVLRSIVVPLEEEIKALKEKLRATDEELQTHRITTSSSSQLIDLLDSHQNENSINKSTSMDLKCESCKILEEKLQDAFNKITEINTKNDNLKKLVGDSKEDLKKEAALRQDLESQWQEKRETNKQEAHLLSEQAKKSEKELLNIQERFLATKNEIQRQLSMLTEDRERVNKHLEKLQSDNDFLSGRYLASSEELDSQDIDLPNNVQELHELVLQQKGDLIKARLGCEYERRNVITLQDSNQVLRDQLACLNAEKDSFERDVKGQMKSLEERIRESMKKEQNYEILREKLERSEVELNKQISELRVRIIELEETNKKLELMKSELKSKMKNLQDDLQTSEHVQKDFVKLSQSLQMALEKFRNQDQEVRWQDVDDVQNCPQCACMFTVTVRKVHCRHCGQIYCQSCLKQISSGPRKRLAAVCDICHTLLSPNKAPYFSKEPPS